MKLSMSPQNPRRPVPPDWLGLLWPTRSCAQRGCRSHECPRSTLQWALRSFSWDHSVLEGKGVCHFLRNSTSVLHDRNWAWDYTVSSILEVDAELLDLCRQQCDNLHCDTITRCSSVISRPFITPHDSKEEIGGKRGRYAVRDFLGGLPSTDDDVPAGL